MAVYLRLPQAPRDVSASRAANGAHRCGASANGAQGRCSCGLAASGLGYLNLTMAHPRALGHSGKCSPPAAPDSAVALVSGLGQRAAPDLRRRPACRRPLRPSRAAGAAPAPGASPRRLHLGFSALGGTALGGTRRGWGRASHTLPGLGDPASAPGLEGGACVFTRTSREGRTLRRARGGAVPTWDPRAPGARLGQAAPLPPFRDLSSASEPPTRTAGPTRTPSTLAHADAAFRVPDPAEVSSGHWGRITLEDNGRPAEASRVTRPGGNVVLNLWLESPSLQIGDHLRPQVSRTCPSLLASPQATSLSLHGDHLPGPLALPAFQVDIGFLSGPQRFTLVWTHHKPSTHAEAAMGLCPAPTELQKMLSSRKGRVGRWEDRTGPRAGEAAGTSTTGVLASAGTPARAAYLSGCQQTSREGAAQGPAAPSPNFTPLTSNHPRPGAPPHHHCRHSATVHPRPGTPEQYSLSPPAVSPGKPLACRVQRAWGAAHLDPRQKRNYTTQNSRGWPKRKCRLCKESLSSPSGCTGTGGEAGERERGIPGEGGLESRAGGEEEAASARRRRCRCRRRLRAASPGGRRRAAVLRAPAALGGRLRADAGQPRARRGWGPGAPTPAPDAGRAKDTARGREGAPRERARGKVRGVRRAAAGHAERPAGQVSRRRRPGGGVHAKVPRQRRARPTRGDPGPLAAGEGDRSARRRGAGTPRPPASEDPGPAEGARADENGLGGGTAPPGGRGDLGGEGAPSAGCRAGGVSGDVTGGDYSLVRAVVGPPLTGRAVAAACGETAQSCAVGSAARAPRSRVAAPAPPARPPRSSAAGGDSDSGEGDAARPRGGVRPAPLPASACGRRPAAGERPEPGARLLGAAGLRLAPRAPGPRPVAQQRPRSERVRKAGQEVGSCGEGGAAARGPSLPYLCARRRWPPSSGDFSDSL
ncbi:collagen alpha-1(I) chain-like [Cynocephalus volans]|uniref:collagen alpha-1(I) chain-like n=1 Tax=Cynocephalus volans TaxID=110931 RepID=UPI002FC8B0E7